MSELQITFGPYQQLQEMLRGPKGADGVVTPALQTLRDEAVAAAAAATASENQAADAATAAAISANQAGTVVTTAIAALRAEYAAPGGAGLLGTNTGETVQAKLTRVDAYTPYAAPPASGVNLKKVEILAGVVRQDTTDKKKWLFIQDTAHGQMGFDSVYATAAARPPFGNMNAAGGSLYIYYLKTYRRVISLIATPDETLANVFGFSCGASVGTEYFSIQGSIRKQIAGICRYDVPSASWVVTMGTYQGAPPSATFAAQSLTLTHYNGTDQLEYCPGVDVKLTPYSNNSSVVPYLPALRSIVAGSFVVDFINPATGAKVTFPDARCSFAFSKNASMPAVLDGTGGFDAVPFSAGGNIWITATLEAP